LKCVIKQRTSQKSTRTTTNIFEIKYDWSSGTAGTIYLSETKIRLLYNVINKGRQSLILLIHIARTLQTAVPLAAEKDKSAGY
jgi:hypothetical protein